jgi:mono/diheme cytochrome c family protein
MSKFAAGIVGLLMVTALLPFVLVARSRSTRSANEQIHLVPDMDHQPRFDPQAASPVFADGRAMRPQVAGTVAQEDLMVKSEILNDVENPRLVDGESPVMMLSDPGTYAEVTLGRTRGANETDEQFNGEQPVTVTNPKANDTDISKDTFYVRTIPSQVRVTTEFMHRGQERFNIYCAPCHGQSGYGDGMVDQRATRIQTSGGDAVWTHPQNLHEAKILMRPDGNIFNTITNGVRTMPPYDKQITTLDRWAIVAYVRALERSQQAQPGDVAGVTQ